jgi:hypothetical protein
VGGGRRTAFLICSVDFWVLADLGGRAGRELLMLDVGECRPLSTVMHSPITDDCWSARFIDVDSTLPVSVRVFLAKKSVMDLPFDEVTR